MWNLISIKEKRKYIILKHLFHLDYYVNYEYLSKLLHCSKRSVINYIDEIKNEIASIDGVIISNHDGVKLNLPNNICFEQFQRSIFKKSIYFTIIEILLIEVENIRHSLQEMLSLSESTLNRYIRILNSSLARFRISVSGTPLMLGGEEYYIRQFLHRYYIEAYAPYEWPFQVIDELAIKDIIYKFYHYLGYDDVSYHSDAIKLAIDFIRVKNKFSNNSISVQLYRIIENHVPLYKNQLSDHLSDSSFDTDIFVESLCYWEPFLRKIFIDEVAIYNSHETSISMFNIKSFLNNVSSALNIPIDIPVNDILLIEEALSLSTMLSAKSLYPDFILFPDKTAPCTLKYKKLYPAFYDYISMEIEKFYSNRSIHPISPSIKDTFFNVIGNWQSLNSFLFEKFSVVKILLYSHLDTRCSQHILNYLRIQMPSWIILTLYEDSYFSYEKAQDYAFDIIISTMHISSENSIEVLYIGYDYLANDNIIYQANKILDEKKENLSKLLADKI